MKILNKKTIVHREEQMNHISTEILKINSHDWGTALIKIF